MAKKYHKVPLGDRAWSDDGMTWYWDTPGWHWSWFARQGLNLSARPKGRAEEWQYVARVDKLNEAVTWSYGYQAGRDAQCATK